MFRDFCPCCRGGCRPPVGQCLRDFHRGRREARTRRVVGRDRRRQSGTVLQDQSGGVRGGRRLHRRAGSRDAQRGSCARRSGPSGGDGAPRQSGARASTGGAAGARDAVRPGGEGRRRRPAREDRDLLPRRGDAGTGEQLGSGGLVRRPDPGRVAVRPAARPGVRSGRGRRPLAAPCRAAQYVRFHPPR